jgi:hypothetical protein
MWRRRYTLVPYKSVALVATQTEAAHQANAGGIGIVMAAAEQPKTAVFRCPSGCGEILRINLMPEMGRAWHFRLDAKGRLSLFPSVDLSSGCRAHFVMAGNTARVVKDF